MLITNSIKALVIFQQLAMNSQWGDRHIHGREPDTLARGPMGTSSSSALIREDWRTGGSFVFGEDVVSVSN